MPPATELEVLLREERWLRRLARRLVADPGAADDLVQDTWLAALEAGGRTRLSRSWLASVVRNLWRERLESSARRARREAVVARAEALDPVDALTAELELRQHVGRALLELEEPFRRALVLRFLRGASLRELARAEGVSVTRAHERVEEGLARLRRALDRAHGGERRRWLPALAGLARRGAGAGASALPLVLLVGVAVVALGAGALRLLVRAPAPARAPVAPAVAVGVEEAPGGAPERAGKPEGREPLGVAASGAPGEARARDGIVLELDGRVRPGVELVGAPQVLVSGADGRFAHPADFAGELRARDARLATLVPGVLREEERVVVLGPAQRVAGRVLDESGLAVAGARVAFRLRERLFRELGLVRPGGAAPQAWSTTSDARGRFALEGVVRDPRTYLALEADGFVAREQELVGGETELEVVLVRDLEQRLYAGRVRTASGEPVAEAWVAAGERIVVTDAQGAFRLPFRGPPADAWLTAAVRGRLPARVALAELDPALPVELVLGSEPLTLRGRVLGPDGAPRRACQVWVRDPTPFGRVLERPGDESGAFQDEQWLEDFLGGGFRAARTGSDGRFELDGLLAREYELLVQSEVDGTRSGPWRVTAGSEAVLRLEPEPDTGPVAGRVLDLDGRPVEGVRVVPLRSATRDLHEHPPWLDPLSGRTTDAEGRFTFERLARAGTLLELRHPQLFRPLFALSTLDDPARCALVVPLLCELELEPTPRGAGCDGLRVLDALGHELELCFASADVVARASRVPVRDGRTGVLRVPQSARTLVLLRGEEESLRLPLELDPRARTRVAP